MIDRQTRLTSRVSTFRAGTTVAAGLMILAGIVLQLGQLGYDGLALKNFWFISMIAGNVWNFLATRSDVPALGELLRFWPMLLVATGLALLAIPYSACVSRLSVSRVRISDCE